MGSTSDRKSASKTSATKQKDKSVSLKNFVAWFEIPALDVERAVRFYSTILGISMDVSHSNEFVMAFFPTGKGIGGAIVAGPGCTPSSVGPLIYLNAGKHLDDVLARIEPAGGRVVMPRTEITEDAGSFALFIDSEGNRMALHSKV